MSSPCNACQRERTPTSSKKCTHSSRSAPSSRLEMASTGCCFHNRRAIRLSSRRANRQSSRSTRFVVISGTFQIPVDSSQETSGGSRMLIRISNRDDASTSTTNQRQHDEVYQTGRFRSPDPYPYRHARVAASRCLWENDGNRTIVSDIPDLSLPTPFYGKPAIGNAV